MALVLPAPALVTSRLWWSLQWSSLSAVLSKMKSWIGNQPFIRVVLHTRAATFVLNLRHPKSLSSSEDRSVILPAYKGIQGASTMG